MSSQYNCDVLQLKLHGKLELLRLKELMDGKKVWVLDGFIQCSNYAFERLAVCS